MIETFEKYLKGTNLAANTLAAYLFAVRQYEANFTGITPKTLREYKIFLIERYKPKDLSINN